MLALLMPGLGQIYNIEYIRGALFFAAFALTPPLFSYAAVLLDGGHLCGIVLAGVLLTAVLFVISIVDAVRHANSPRPPHGRNIVILIALLPVLCAGGVLYPLSEHIRKNVIESFYAPSASMEPSIAKGDFFFVNKRVNAPGFRREIKRGDIVVFVAQNNRNRCYVKRVIGLPGDTLRYRQNMLSVNDKQITVDTIDRTQSGVMTGLERADSQKTYTIQWSPQSAADVNITVPPGHIFVLGDNRNNAVDSRSFGPVPLRDVAGIAWQVWFNRDLDKRSRIGTLLSPNQ